MSDLTPLDLTPSDLTPDSIVQTLSACREKCDAIGESLNQCFGSRLRLAAGDPLPYDGAAPDPELHGPGLVLALSIGNDVMLCALPASLPPLDWDAHPETNKASRLQGLATAWSRDCRPDDRPAESSVAHTVDDLWETIADCRPPAIAVWLPLEVVDEAESPSGGPPSSRIWILWPVAEVPLPSTVAAGAEIPDELGDPFDSDSFDPDSFDADSFDQLETGQGGVFAAKAPRRIDRLLKVRVPIIVKLAEKKIELGQLLAIGPGAIVTFEKSCEDLLDLHVNNKLYCRGEAVKIGEKFGLKINEVGSVEQRVSALLRRNA